jgi:4-amino-4-deoxy-L-arabinose transferase-like glycosyltransferase
MNLSFGLGEFLRRANQERTLLALGIALRVVTFLFLAPLNPDTGHLDNIQFLVKYHVLPPTEQFSQAYHPPLYYLLAAPILYFTGSVKAVQFLSLVLSIATLFALDHLMCQRGLVPAGKPRVAALALACLLPQFVMYGLYVSNDSLAIFLGAVVMILLCRFLEDRSTGRMLLLALSVGLGLLTKATFLAFLPVLGFIVFFVRMRESRSLRRGVLTGVALLVTALFVGGYKFAENYVRLGSPFVSNLDFNYPWVYAQKQSYRGVASFLDFNLLKLLKSPAVSPATEGSYPLLLYGTFWYQHIPESNFAGDRRAPFNYLGSVIYLLALVPSVLCAIGTIVLLKAVPRLLRSGGFEEAADRQTLMCAAALFILFGNLLLIFTAAFKYHVWSILQGRLLFPSFLGLLVAYGAGFAASEQSGWGAKFLNGATWALAALFLLYFASEYGYQVLLWVNPGAKTFLKRVPSLP